MAWLEGWRSRSRAAGLVCVALLGFTCDIGTDHDRIAVRQSDCLVCHEADFQQAVDPPHGALPTTCGTCHGNEAWSPAAFEHAWPLTGAHGDLTCNTCHVGEPPVYAGTPTTCVGCHQDDYDASPFTGHSDFPTTCENCHTTTAWTPAVGGAHPENAFPIQSGPHSKYRDDCVSCHNPELGSSVDGENADCVGCHDGNHTREKMDPKHDEEPEYPQGAAPPNFCLDCHPAGLNEDD